MSKHAGDPSPRSPSDVLVDRSYRVVASDLHWGPNSNQVIDLVVLHAGTETYWEASYDSMHGGLATTWIQGVPKAVQRIEYRRI